MSVLFRSSVFCGDVYFSSAAHLPPTMNTAMEIHRQSYELLIRVETVAVLCLGCALQIHFV